ncbi:MAG: hypothetical protein QOJ99_2472 [Bryobacterales bacterium]|nr:hypothetical protein [Bryobacterales bacterium]
MIRTVILLLAFATLSPAWVESVEFPWNSFPKHLWARELAWLKNIGIHHVSLPAASDPAQLADLIRTLRRLDMEADLEGPIPDSLQTQTKAHGGPLTDRLPRTAARISALGPDALTHSRRLLTSGVPALIWTDVEETLNASGHHAGAVNFAGDESPATVPLRRNAQLSGYWGETLASLTEVPVIQPLPGLLIRQFVSPKGLSFVSILNTTAKPWTGDVKLKRSTIPNVTVLAHDSAWLPVNVPLAAGPLCKDCTAFATTNHLVYATAELTDMEYENGILALEFSAPSPGEVVLQLSREPAGPLVAGGKPADIDWDDKTQQVRLPIPQGAAVGHHVRIGLAIEAPDATAFFNSARVLLIGETNHLTAEFSSEAIAQRSRLRTTPELSFTQDPTKQPLEFVYNIKVPDTAIHGDHADLSIEADGARMSHARPQILRPVTLRFPDGIAVRLASNSVLALSPSIVPVNQRTGRDFTVSIRNNAPEIRSYKLEMKAEGLEFSPARMDLTVGASATREVSFRVFPAGAVAGLHSGEARLSGAATAIEPVRFVVIPQTGAIAYSADGFSFLESTKTRASFIPGHWLEFISKDNGQTAIPPGGNVFTAGAIETRGDTLVIGQKTLRLQDLEQLAPRPKK